MNSNSGSNDQEPMNLVDSRGIDFDRVFPEAAISTSNVNASAGVNASNSSAAQNGSNAATTTTLFQFGHPAHKRSWNEIAREHSSFNSWPASQPDNTAATTTAAEATGNHQPRFGVPFLFSKPKPQTSGTTFGQELLDSVKSMSTRETDTAYGDTNPISTKAAQRVLRRHVENPESIVSGYGFGANTNTNSGVAQRRGFGARNAFEPTPRKVRRTDRMEIDGESDMEFDDDDDYNVQEQSPATSPMMSPAQQRGNSNNSSNALVRHNPQTGTPAPPMAMQSNHYYLMNNNQPQQPRDKASEIMRYIHVAFNLIMVSIAVFGVLYFGTMIINDIKIKTESQSSNILAEISICRQEYSKNRCDPPNLRLPALEPKCIEWEICMNRDHNDVTRARLSAETFAEILNSFVDPISTKSMAFIFAFYFGVTILGNLVLNWNTGRSHPNNGPQQQPVPHPPVNPYNGGGGGSSGVTSNDGSMPTPYYQQPPPQYQYQHPEPPPLTPFHMPVYRGPVSAAATPMTTATANRPNPFMRRNDFSAKTPIPPPRFGATANNAGGGNGNGGGAMFGGDIQRSESPVPGSFMSSTNSLFGVKSAKKLR